MDRLGNHTYGEFRMTSLLNDMKIEHEALDRCALIADLINRQLLSHTYFKNNPGKQVKVEQAFDILHSLYSQIMQEVE
jgi:hypothetical protein